jgi:hypothetical protein
VVELSDFEKDTLAWGSRYVKKPWAEMVEKMGRIGAGEQLTKEERMIELELVPWMHFDIKVAMNITTTYLYDLLKIPNATMFTIILGEKGKRIIWASMEHEENGIYQEFVPIKDRLDEDWAKEAAKLIVENRLDDLFKYLSDWISKDPELKHMELGLIKIAGIQFFDQFRKAWELSNMATDVGTMLAYMIEAFKTVFENNWIMFEPEPYGINVLRKMFLEKMALNPEQLKNGIMSMLPDMNLGIALLSEEWGTMIKVTKKGEAMTIDTDQDEADAAFEKGINLKQYVDKVRKRFKAKRAIGLDASKLIKLILKIVKAPSPWDFEKIDKGLSFILPGVKNYKKHWYISPELIFMKGSGKWILRRFGYDMEIERFSDWWVSELLMFVMLNMLGLQFKMVTFILDDDGGLEMALLIEGDEGRLQKMKTFPEEMFNKLKDIFDEEEDKTEAVARAKFTLWKEFGWIKYAIGVKASVLQEAIKKIARLSGFILALPFRILFFYFFLKKLLKNELYMVPIIPFDKVFKDIGLRDLMKVGKAAMGVLFDDPDVEYPDLAEEGLA